MKYLLTLLLFCSTAMADSFIDFKFHYGDKVKIRSNTFRVCHDQMFVNVCSKVGTVIGHSFNENADCMMYYIKFDFEGLESQQVVYCEKHLKKVK